MFIRNTLIINQLQINKTFAKNPYLYVELCYSVIVAFFKKKPQSSFLHFLLSGSRIKVQQSDGSDGAGGLAICSLRTRASGGQQQTHYESKGSEINSQYHLWVEGLAPHKNTSYAIRV